MLTMCFEANLALVTHALYLLDCVLRLKTEKNNEAKIITRVPQEARVIKVSIPSTVEAILGFH